MEEISDNHKQSDTEMSEVPAPAAINKNVQAVTPKNMVPDSGWFDGSQMKFKDWWRGM